MVLWSSKTVLIHCITVFFPRHKPLLKLFTCYMLFKNCIWFQMILWWHSESHSICISNSHKCHFWYNMYYQFPENLWCLQKNSKFLKPLYLKFLRADFGFLRLINNGLSLRKRSRFENIEGWQKVKLFNLNCYKWRNLSSDIQIF